MDFFQAEISNNLFEHCRLHKKTGPCKAMMLKYYYNTTSGSCQKFYYGGCAGNKNNFDNLKACESDCPSQGTPKGKYILAFEMVK